MIWLHDLIAGIPERLLVFLIDGVFIHVAVHGRDEQDRCFARHDGCAEEVIGKAVCHLAN